MSVGFLFNYLIIRKAALEKQYQGGLDKFRAELIPDYGDEAEEDPYLLCFVSMGWYLESLVDRLTEVGILGPDHSSTSDVYYGSIADENESECDWLTFGIEERYPICWLKGTSRGKKGRSYLL